ncbi:MAG: hypothetical protein HYS55_04805 [Candidatus Omnitrophica bacterium]|nr:hypothetical protein [Candidatus Omnitrophota bacterium]
MPRILNEEEIQKKLYGRYHKGTGTQKAEGPRVNVNTQQLVIKTSSQSVPVSTRLKVWVIRITSQMGLLLKKFPWKLFSVVTVLLVLAILGFQHIPNWFLKGKPPLAQAGRMTGGKISVEPIQSRKASETIDSSSVTLTKPEAETRETTTSKKRYFAVQICTYQREQDARQLTGRLHSMNFPAFYSKSSSSRGLSHYVVFLSKEESYAQANSKLAQFRRTSEFRKFSDAFIRSL